MPDLVTAGGPLVAVRISSHPVFRAVSARFGRPIAAPSANRFGRISPTTGAHVLTELAGRIPLILEAGPTPHGLESTVIRLADEDDAIHILRPGPVTAEMLAAHAMVIRSDDDADARSGSPGQTAGHYAPRTPLTLSTPEHVRFARDLPQKTGWIGFRADRPMFGQGDAALIEYLSVAGDLREAAACLFAILRQFDEAGLDRIIVGPIPEEGLGRAINERLRRAEAGSGEADPVPRVRQETA